MTFVVGLFTLVDTLTGGVNKETIIKIELPQV